MKAIPELDITHEFNGITFMGFPGDLIVNIDHFLIKEKFRHFGYGQTILHMIVKWYQQYGTEVITVTSAIPEGRPFYKRYGFLENNMKDFHLNLSLGSATTPMGMFLFPCFVTIFKSTSLSLS